MRIIRKKDIVRFMQNDPIIEVNNLCYNYGSEQVLKSLSFKINRGDFAGLIGGNGSGKTTLIRSLLGLLPILSGSIKLFGTDLTHFREWNKLGYLPQKAGSINSDFPITVEEFVALPLNSVRFGLHKTRINVEKKVTEVLSTVGMDKLKNRRIGNLSGGQLQRVFIAKALVSEPKLLILDEPTVGVDFEAEAEIYSLLQSLNRDQNITILWVSHDIDAVSSLTNKLLCFGPQGFFEHRYCEGEEKIDLPMLYNYEVLAHIHH